MTSCKQEYPNTKLNRGPDTPNDVDVVTILPKRVLAPRALRSVGQPLFTTPTSGPFTPEAGDTIFVMAIHRVE